MRSFYLLIIVAIFGAVVVLAAAIILTSPALVPEAGTETPGGSVKYALDSPLPLPQYYTGIDFSTLKSDSNLTVLPMRSVRQQVTNYSCGAVAAMTVLSYYGMPVNNTDAEEIRVAHEIYPGVSETTGLNPEQVAAWLSWQGMNSTWGTGGSRAMLVGNLKNGVPTMVEWMDWGGHWVVVTGYDTRGTENVRDDVIHAVLIQGGGADALKFPAGQGRLEYIGSIQGTAGAAGAYDGVDFINEKDHVPVFLQFVHDGLHALFKLAAVFGSGYEGSQVQGNHPLIKQHPGNLPLHNAQGQAFHDGGLTHTGFTNEDGVVFLPAG